jgi:hypothetical protein
MFRVIGAEVLKNNPVYPVHPVRSLGRDERDTQDLVTLPPIG